MVGIVSGVDNENLKINGTLYLDITNTTKDY